MPIDDNTPDETTRITALLQGDLKRALDSIAAQAGDRNSERIGLRALLQIYKDLGDKGVSDFVQWAVNGSNGFLPQDHDVKPLPEDVHKIFENIARQENKATPLSKNDIRRIEARRRFLKMATATFVGGMFGNIDQMISDSCAKDARGRPVDIPQAERIQTQLYTTGVFALIGLYVGIGLEKIQELSGRGLADAVLRRRGGAFMTNKILPEDREWDVDSVARAVAALLESYISKKQEIQK